MPYTFKQIAGMSVDQISNLASRGETYREFCAAVKRAAKAAATVSEPAEEMDLWPDDPAPIADKAADHVFRDFAKALGLETWNPQDGSETWEGDVWATAVRMLEDAGVIGPETGERASPSTQHVEADVLGGIRICPERDGPCPHGMECPFNGDRYGCDMVGSRAARGTTPSVDEIGKGSE